MVPNRLTDEERAQGAAHLWRHALRNVAAGLMAVVLLAGIAGVLVFGILALIASGSFLHIQEGRAVAFPIVYEAGEAIGIHDALDGLYFTVSAAVVVWFGRKLVLRHRAELRRRGQLLWDEIIALWGTAGTVALIVGGSFAFALALLWLATGRPR